MDSEDLLHTNQFVSRVSVKDQSQATQYKQYREQKQKQKAVIKQDQDHPEGTSAFNKSLTPTTAHTTDRAVRDRVTVVSIDTRDRNKLLYPKPNNFKVYLGKTFTNVHEIKLISTEFPNSDKAIKDTPPELANNTFYWINEDEADLGYPIYKYSIPPGNYDTYTLQVALSSNLNRVRRRNGTGQFHYFDVTVSILTDVVTFKSLLITNLDANPYLVTKDSNVLTVTQNNHNFKVGDSVALFGSQSTGGIDSARLDGYYTVHDVPSINTFQVLLPTVAVQNIQGGGTLAKSGRRAPFKMLVGTQADNIGNPLGFSLEDSAIPIGQIGKSDDANITTVSGTIPTQLSLTQLILPDTLARSYDVYQQCKLAVNGQERTIVSYDPGTNTAAVDAPFSVLPSALSTVFIDKGYRQVPVTNPIQTVVYDIQQATIQPSTQKIRLVYQTENDQGSGSAIEYFPTFTGVTPLQTQTTHYVMPASLARNNDVYQNCWIQIGQQVRLITSYNPMNNTAALQSPWTTLPATGASVYFYQPLFTSAVISDIVRLSADANTTVIETASPHGLAQEQLVTFARSQCTPKIDGTRLIAEILSPTRFRVDFPVQSVEPVAYAVTVHQRFPVVKIVPDVTMTTLTIENHGFSNHQQIRIVSSQTTPSLDGVYTITVLDDNTITVPATVSSVTPRALLKVSGDTVRILNLMTIPRIPTKNDVFVVEDATAGTFDIDFPASQIESVQNAKIGTGVLQITHPEHGFNTVTFIDTVKSIFETLPTPLLAADSNIASISSNTTVTLGNQSNTGTFVWSNFVPTAATSYRLSMTTQAVGVSGQLSLENQQDTLFTTTVTTTPSTHVFTFLSDDPVNFKYVAIAGATVIITQVTLEMIVAGTIGVTTQFPHNLNGYEFINVPIVQDTGDSSLANLTIANHPFSYNDRIKLSDFESTPSYNLPLAEFYQVARVVNDNVFSIKISNVLSAGTVTVRTSGTDHEIILTGTTSVPPIDGRYEVITQSDDVTDQDPATATDQNAFRVSTRGNLTTGASLPDIETPGYTGTIGYKNNVALYRATGATSTSLDVAGIPLYRLNGTYYNIDTLMDEDHYQIRIPDVFAVEKVQGGGSDVYVSSEKHGFNFLQDNTTDGVTLNRNIQLEGENYVFLVSPGLGTVLNSAGIDDVFAKILLTEPPGLMIFNSFITNSKTFDEAPLARLSEMEFRVLTGTGFLYDFNNVDFSFSLEIREYADTIAEAQVSSRRGAPETTNVLSSAARPNAALRSAPTNNFERYGQLY